jgi:protein Mpv17
VRRRAAFDASVAKSHEFGIELDQKLDQALPHYGEELVPTHSSTQHLPPPFDFERLARFASWGFVVAPFQFKWLQLLQRTFPLTSASATLPALKRVAMDQTLFAPAGLLGFFTYMTYSEGGDTGAVKKRLGNVFFPTLKANYMLWPAVQLLNFRVMPLQFQLPFASTVGIAWGTYLSLTNSSSEDP